MKRVICMLIAAVLLCGCTAPAKNEKTEPERIGEYIKGVWLSYSEVERMLSSGNFTAAFDTAADNCADLGITDMFVHVRAFCDAVYPSEYFPQTESSAALGFDALEYMVSACHARGMRIHGWINPYRVRTADTDISKLPQKSPAYIWLNNQNGADDKNVCLSGGIYLNPAEEEVQRLCLDGVRELLDNYSLDGIHMDDYFYPTADPAFDEASYSEYCAGSERPLSLEEWRRASVDALISGCRSAVKQKSEDIIFSVSPAADIDKNYNEYFADVSGWIEGGYVDWIIPQLYFGFEYPDKNFRFDSLLEDWKALNPERTVKLMIGLAAYKTGTDSYPDSAEWASRDDILSRQAQLCFDDALLNGHIFFSYSSLFSDEPLNTAARERLEEG